MLPRASEEPHRASTPLELFFDLVFVVAVSLAAVALASAEVAGHTASGAGSYLMVFFAIWWAWLNFTWFASAFDTDDWLYRLTTLVQMAGALVLAAGVPTAAAHGDFTYLVLGYVIMRLAMVSQWLRAARSDPGHRSTALRYALGITLVQVAWVLRQLLPGPELVPAFVVLVVAECAVPVWAERAGMTTWHPRHIAERYGLFTLIVLGEVLLASTSAVSTAVDEGGDTTRLLVVAASGVVLVASMWWVYFDAPQHELLTGLRPALVWGYGHYVVFAAAGAVSAGVEVAVAHVSGDAEGMGVAAAATTTVPVAAFLLAVWFLLLRPRRDRTTDVVLPALAVLVAAAALAPEPLVVAAVLAAAAAALLTVRRAVREARAA
jgi:low temperature requirement protein LtrA